MQSDYLNTAARTEYEYNDQPEIGILGRKTPGFQPQKLRVIHKDDNKLDREDLESDFLDPRFDPREIFYQNKFAAVMKGKQSAKQKQRRHALQEAQKYQREIAYLKAKY